jgi:hypothetical protein
MHEVVSNGGVDTGPLSLGVAAQQATTTTTTKGDQGAKQDMKDAGHETKNAAQKTAHATTTTTRKVVHKGAQKTGEGAAKVEGKTQPQ